LLSADLTLPTILDERGRELYWEGHRRTDLIRYGLLTTSTYLWPFKGGVANGTAVNQKYNLFPIPDDMRTANSNLTQNLGYNP
jgi:starch-binding outer membrane protein, SusD/RagB family